MNANSNLAKVIVGAIIVGVVAIIFSQAPEVLAQTNGDAGGFVPCGNTADNPCQVGHLFSAFIVIINYLITMAGFIAVLAIVYAGFLMIYSQGQEQLKEAKGRFSGAVIGLVLVAAAFILINALFTGSLSVGVKDGANILSNPLDYIKGSNTNTNTNTNANTNTTKSPTKPK
jgi:hypothetical protein